MRVGLVLLCVWLAALPASAQPCAPVPLDLAAVNTQLAAINARLAQIEAYQAAEAKKKPTLVVVLGNRYLELALISVAAFIGGLKVR